MEFDVRRVAPPRQPLGSILPTHRHQQHVCLCRCCWRVVVLMSMLFQLLSLSFFCVYRYVLLDFRLRIPRCPGPHATTRKLIRSTIVEQLFIVIFPAILIVLATPHPINSPPHFYLPKSGVLDHGPLKQVAKEGEGAPGPTGFSALVMSQGLFVKGKKSSSDYRWEAPGIIRVRTKPEKESSPGFGASLHCTPLGKGRSRLLFKVSYASCLRVSVFVWHERTSGGGVCLV